MVFEKGHKQLNTGKTHFKKGMIPWNKGKKMWKDKEHPKGMFGKKAWNRGKKLSKEHKRKLRLAWIERKKEGNYLKKLSEETKKKISIANRGNKHTKETKRKIGKKNKGKHFSPKTEFRKGHKPNEETKKKLIKNNPMRGKTHWCWKGGITPINDKIRRSKVYKGWRTACFKRDNWTCNNCNKIGGKLHAHHIKSFAKYPKLRFEIRNGVTVCENCHKLTKSYGRPKKARRL